MTTNEPLQHVSPGQQFRPTANAWNAFVDTARIVREQRVIFGVPPLQATAAEGAKTIVFRPIGVAPGIGFTCDAVLAVVLMVHCGSDVQVGDEVIVLDPNLRFDNSYSAAGFFRMPQDLLFRSSGVATWMTTNEDEYDRPEGIGNCRWVCTNMFCAEPSEY